MFISSLVIAVQVSIALAVPLAGPTVTLDSATVTGVTEGRVARFLGIPYAQPPIGDRRFRSPEPITPYTGSIDATSTKPACPQQQDSVPIPDGIVKEVLDFIVHTLEAADTPDSEDCLNINVLKPVDATPNSQLPVLVWIFGGGFESGSATGQNGNVIVERSLDLNQPVIHVSLDYRSNGFGFLASKEVKDAGIGNLGLRDQREALRWVQKYIGAFGGDPTKVTIWGESAGAISVALQMVTNGGDTEDLFRAAFMESGATIPVGDIANGQIYYDQIVSETGCSGSADTLACLRQVSYQSLKDAINNTPGIFSYQSLHLAWLPRVDGDFLTDSPQKLAQQGKVANIPFVSGNCDDEGTVFALSSLNVTTDDDVREYLKTVLLPPDVSDEDVSEIMRVYPADPSQGSPYNTGPLNAITPQFKRLASIQGDVVFQGPRRFLLQSLSGKRDMWSFLSKRFKIFPVVGSTHGTDLLNVYGGGDMADYLIRFAATLDPNGDTGIPWPKYTTTSPNLLTFQDIFQSLVITQDTYRQEAMQVSTNILLEHPL
ncbi:carotenoid ester lipase precursor [Marasmius fiardii PR-910]|nr:carotenoid ester lipase precursor [Marasmius fiardii PR-910]